MEKHIINKYVDVTLPNGQINRYHLRDLPMSAYIMEFCKEGYKLREISQGDYYDFRKKAIDMDLEDGYTVEMYVLKFANDSAKEAWDIMYDSL